MQFIDLFVLLVLLWAFFQGWRAGFIKQLASLGGFVVGLVIAGTLYSTLGDYLAPHLGTHLGVARFLAFILLWIVVPILLGFVATLFTRAMKGAIGLPNRLLGAALSVFKFVLLLSCLFNVMGFLNLISDQKQAQSISYRPVKGAVSALFGTMREHKARRDSIDAAQQPDTFYIYPHHNGAKQGKQAH